MSVDGSAAHRRWTTTPGSLAGWPSSKAASKANKFLANEEWSPRPYFRFSANHKVAAPADSLARPLFISCPSERLQKRASNGHGDSNVSDFRHHHGEAGLLFRLHPFALERCCGRFNHTVFSLPRAAYQAVFLSGSFSLPPPPPPSEHSIELSAGLRWSRQTTRNKPDLAGSVTFVIYTHTHKHTRGMWVCVCVCGSITATGIFSSGELDRSAANE